MFGLQEPVEIGLYVAAAVAVVAAIVVRTQAHRASFVDVVAPGLILLLAVVQLNSRREPARRAATVAVVGLLVAIAYVVARL